MKRRIVAIVTLCLIAILSAVGLVACDNTIKQTGITLDKTTMTIILGDTDELTATIAPEDATDKTVVWTSSNDAVATVEDGTVTAVAVGTATITAKTADDKFSATCAVTVIGSELTFNTLVKDGDVYKKEVSNATTTFSFVDEVAVTGHASFVVATDAEGTNVDADKIIDLAEGTNVAYVIKSVSGTVTETYQVQIYRKHVYTVTFNANGAVFATASVDEGTAVSAPENEPTKQGYTFDGWDFDFATLINEAKTIEAKWAPATDTAYTVEYYLEKLDGTYEKKEELTEALTGTTDSTVTATKTIENFTYNASAAENVASGVVAADGSLVLRLYYTRKTVAVTATAEGGSVAGAGEVKYGAEATLEATAFVGYDFAGWYKGEEKVAETAIYNFTVMGATALTAKFVAKAELAGFTFTATADTCVITGVEDTSIYQVVIPAFVTEIADEAFEGCVRLVEVINNSESFVVAKGETTNGSVGKYAYAVANCDAEYESKIQEMEEDGIKAIAYMDEATFTSVIIEYTTEATTAMFGQVTAVLKDAFAKSVNLEKIYFTGTAAEKAEIDIKEGAIAESVVWYFFSYEVPTEVGNYWYMEVVGETPTPTEWDAATIAKANLAKGLGQAELANLDSEDYLSLISHTKGSVDDYSIEYLDEYQGKTGVIKISGVNAKDAVFTLQLPKVMTSTKTGTQTSGQSTIKEKDAEGNETDVEVIFNLTDIVAEMYVVNAGSGAFGFLQSIYEGDKDYGWGGKNFTATLGEWKDYAKDLITADHIRFAVGAGDFEFYVAGVYQGTEQEVVKAKLASTLEEGELLNFKSQDALKLITNDPVYGGRPGLAEIGTFHGKDNVLKITQYVSNVYKCPIYLPKSPTGDKITIQFYLEGGEGFRFGLLNIAAAGWMNPNHSTTYETGKWVTVVYTGFADFANATYQMLRFNTEGGTAPDAIYIAGVWDGDQTGAILGKEMLSTLGENELANFDSEAYLGLISQHPTYNATVFGPGAQSVPNATIGNFMGKENVLKLTDANATCQGTFKLALPKGPTQTTITLQVYLVANEEDATTPARFGLFKQEDGGWDDTAAGTNHRTDFARGEWLTIIFTEIDNTGTYNFLYFGFEKNIDEVYIAGIWDGDVREMLNPVE